MSAVQVLANEPSTIRPIRIQNLGWGQKVLKPWRIFLPCIHTRWHRHHSRPWGAFSLSVPLRFCLLCVVFAVKSDEGKIELLLHPMSHRQQPPVLEVLANQLQADRKSSAGEGRRDSDSRETWTGERRRGWAFVFAFISSVIYKSKL